MERAVATLPRLARRALGTDTPVMVTMQELLRGTNDCKSLAQGVVHWPPPQHALDKIKDAIGHPSTSNYGADEGLPELREALVEKLRRENKLCNSSVMVTAGANQVWQEFCITGDVDGRGVPVSNPNGPLDHKRFLDCARDTVKLLCNRSSLALWVGGNEQHPLEDINAALKNDLQLHPFFKSSEIGTNLIDSPIRSKAYEDPSWYLDGTHLYIQRSLWDGFAKGNGDFTDGPYEIQYPEDFFKDDFYQYGFSPEVGSVGLPVAATIRATMSPEAWQIPVFQRLSNGYINEVPNPVWNYHKYIPYSKPGKVHDQIELYGEPKSLDDFCEKAQLVNYIQYRALLEGWTSRL